MRLPALLILRVLLLLAPVAGWAEAPAPQPKLPTVTLTIGDKTLTAEVADEPAEMETGMMMRTRMADGEGMVFVLGTPQKASFWMQNTLIPLSIAYVNATGLILEIHDLKPRDETPVQSSFDTISYAIEVPQGWFLRNGILPGTMVKGLPPTPAGR